MITSNASSTDEGSRGKCAFPLSADIVGLPGKYSRDVGVAASGSEENAKVTDSNRFCESEATEADEHQASIGDNERRANTVLVCIPGKSKSDNGG